MLNLFDFLRNKPCFLAILALLAMSFACGFINSGNELIGTYELKVGKGKIILEVAPNGTFRERVFFESGQAKEIVGHWDWGGEFMSFDKLWIPKSFSPEILNQLDASGRTNFTSPGLHAVTPEKRWGKVILPIFDSESINFTKR
jgi:hypothetical protein